MSIVCKILVCLIALGWAGNGLAYKAADFNSIPPFLLKEYKPSISLLIDTSGSMEYSTSSFDGTGYPGNYTASTTYFGYWNSKTYYTYNATGQFFYENNSTGSWNGNLLNWFCTSRFDAARIALTGGPYNSTYGYSLSNGGYYWIGYYNDTFPVIDLNGNSKHQTPYHDNLRLRFNSGSIDVAHNPSPYTSYVSSVKSNVKRQFVPGVIQGFRDKTRLSLWIYYPVLLCGGKAISYMSDNSTDVDNIINALNTMDGSGGTPLATSVYSILGNIEQNGTILTSGPRFYSDTYADPSNATDPYYFTSEGAKVPCSRQSVIVITDGGANFDAMLTYSMKNQMAYPHNATDYGGYQPYLISVEYFGHTSDQRTDMAGTQTVMFYNIFAFAGNDTAALLMLEDASKMGGFTDKNGNGLPDLNAEWDDDSDGHPDNFFDAQDAPALKTAIEKAFDLASAPAASGTTAAVTSQTREGHGSIYQALFFPPTTGIPIGPSWSGQIHAFLIDSYGNLREDTNHNYRLDLVDDKIVSFNSLGNTILRYTDADGNGKLSTSEMNASMESFDSVTDLNLLWNTTTSLNSISNADVVTQRTYNATGGRYIFTFVDKNDNMIPDSGELQDFVLPSVPSSGSLNNINNFYNYLTLYPAISGSVSLLTTDPIYTLRDSSPSNFNDFQAQLAKRQVDFVRGVDVGNATFYGITDACRSRSVNGTTWRMGDVIYSSPTFVGKPAENYHTIYGDKSYAGFLAKYKNRRQMVYTGANDGMLHAFNGGFFNSTNISFDLTHGVETAYALGEELWGYVPYNLLPHLKWLMDPAYGKQLHVNYMDLKPRAFDARIFFDVDGITPKDSDHPGGWGTVLVAGMRTGGAKIQTKIDKLTSNAYDAATDKTMSSAYVILDITNPEKPPVLLGEITMPYLGFTTCYPTVMPMTSADAATNEDNRWYLVFGSGPANAAGEADRLKLGVETSEQTGKLYVLDMKELAVNSAVKSLDSTNTFNAGAHWFKTTEPGSFISDPSAADFDIGSKNKTSQFKADAIYYGSVAGDNVNGRGAIYRLVTGNTMPIADVVSWDGNSTLISVNKPMVAETAIAMDDAGQPWIYFGSGRFYNRDDIPQAQRMTFYGVKEPMTSGAFTWDTVLKADLFNSTAISLQNATCGNTFNTSCVSVYNSVTHAFDTWSNLLTQVANADGWFVNMDEDWERVLGQASIVGGTVAFTSYLPSTDLCSAEGNSSLWALYYMTGTPFYDPIFATQPDVFTNKVNLGHGMAISPNIYTNPEGTKAFIQTSTGAIQSVDLATPIHQRSSGLYWKNRQLDF